MKLEAQELGWTHQTSATASTPLGGCDWLNRYASTSKTSSDTVFLETDNLSQFSAKYLDTETGLLYYGYRYYSPTLGRWMSRDLLEEDWGANLYNFVEGNPINSADLIGLKKCGVESFVVKWSVYLKIVNGTRALLRLDIKIKFKNDADHDPRCCQYKQNAMTSGSWTHSGKAETTDTSPMHDDGYSRSSDVDGNTDLSSTSFHTNDNPGPLKDFIAEGDVISSYSFTAEQIVYSPGDSFAANPKKKISACNCEKDDNVAKKGPHTATIKGIYSKKLKYTGAPDTL